MFGKGNVGDGLILTFFAGFAAGPWSVLQWMGPSVIRTDTRCAGEIPGKYQRAWSDF